MWTSDYANPIFIDSFFFCREILRVSKWLVRERGDLIKKTCSAGGDGSRSPPKLSPEANFLRLSGTGCSNGLRFSEMEHILQRGEQVWKGLESAQRDQPTCNNSKLQKMMMMMTGGTSDNSQPMTTVNPRDILQLRHLVFFYGFFFFIFKSFLCR